MSISVQAVVARCLGVFLLISCNFSARPSQLQPHHFYINYSAKIDPAVLAAYDLSIVSPYASSRTTQPFTPDKTCFAYLSVVEVASDAPYLNEFLSSGIPVLATNAIWKSRLADITDPKWRSFIVQKLGGQIRDKGFGGFFLDTIDSVELLIQQFPDQRTQFETALVMLIQELRVHYPEQRIIVNRGLRLWKQLRESIHGVLIESLYQTYDFQVKAYKPVPESESQELLRIAQEIQSAGPNIFIVDYVSPDQRELAERTAQRIESHGFSALISTPELQGQIQAPLRETPRFVLTLYGRRHLNPEDSVLRPADSGVARSFQMPLEWLGYEVDYLNLDSASLPSELDSKYAAVILDNNLILPSAMELPVLNWLLKQKNLGTRILVLGRLPFSNEDLLKRFLEQFGCTGSGQEVSALDTIAPRQFSSLMHFETEAPETPSKFLDVRANVAYKVHASYQADDHQRNARVFDAVFTAPWGGIALDPCLFFRQPDFVYLWLLDPFAFLSEALATPRWPAPDTTTLNGQRIFYTHIDGDGFRHRSSVQNGKLSSEIILDRIIKKYPVPITCSVIESEIRAHIIDQKPEDEAKLTALAREMFALPNVEAASHAYTHPFYWDKADPEAALYEAPFLKLMEKYARSDIDYRREIEGSVRYIEDQLLPPGKRISIFLWSGNCRPPPEAVRITRELGIENMNGGDTTISRKHPTVTKIAPRSISMDGELHVYAANQNENVYRESSATGAKGDVGFYGGYIHAVDSFQRTETPRRLKPVNIYFHFYSGDNLVALRALTNAFEWAMGQPLHAVTAARYAQMVRDCRETRLFQRFDNQWVVVNQGHLRTFRIPVGAGTPNLRRSQGILGYARSSYGSYIHGNGSRTTRIALSEAPVNQLFLVSSSAEVRFNTFEAAACEFTAEDLRPINVVFGGVEPNSAVRLMINGTPREASADATGQIHLELPVKAAVKINLAQP